MNKRVSKLIVFNLAIIMLLSLIPSKTLASNENNQLDYEHIDKKSYLNDHKPMVKVLADANSKEEANKQIKNPEQKKTYTMFAEYLVNRNGKKVSAFQPYRATVGESDTIPNIDHQIELPELYGYQKPVDIFKFNYQYIKDHDVATNGPLFHVYNNHKLKIKIKHSFQSLYNKEDFSTIPAKYTTQEVNIGDLVRAIPLPEDQRPGFVPERNIVETVIPDVKDFVMEIRYLRKKVNVTYDTDGGNDIPAKLAIYGQTITAVDPPVKEGSVFEGWEINQDLSKIDNDGTIKDKLYQKGQRTGINKSDSEFKDATPNQDVVFKAKWHDKERTDYAISFWCEKADYDEQEVEKLKKAGDSSYLLKKYDYVGSNIIKDVLSNSRPNLKDIFPNNIVFPDLDNANDMTKDNLPKYYHLNEGLSQEINKEKNGPEIKKISSVGNTNYNIYYDRKIYRLVFECTQKHPDFYPEFVKDGVKYNKENIYSIQVRFGENFGKKWPMASTITNFPKGQGSLDWFDSNAQTYRDLQPYRMSKNDFVKLIKKDPAVKRTDGSGKRILADNEISLGIDYNSKVMPLHVNILCQSIKEAEDELQNKGDADAYEPKDPQDIVYYYLKWDIDNSDYDFLAPSLKGFTPYSLKKKAEKKDADDIEELNEERSEVSQSLVMKFRKFLNTDADESDDDDVEYDKNGYIAFSYKRNKYRLFLNNNPSIRKEQSDADYPDADTKLDVVYDKPLNAIEKLKKLTPKKPSNIPQHYEFKGWCIDQACENLISDTDIKMPDYNMTLYAKWGNPDKYHDLKFDLNGGIVDRDLKVEDIVLKQDPKSLKQIKKVINDKKGFTYTILSGSIVKEPNIYPHKEGYDFIGWEHVRYKDPMHMIEDDSYRKQYGVPEQYAFRNEVVEDATLRAIWIKNNKVPIVSIHKFYDLEGNELVDKRKVVSLAENRIGNYASAYAQFQDEKWLLKDSKSDDKLKRGDENHYFKTKIVQPYDGKGENPNTFVFHYRPFRVRKYGVNYISSNTDGEYNILPMEKVVNGNKDYDARNYRDLPGYKLVGEPQQQLIFNLDEKGQLLGINGTNKDNITFKYEDIRIIKRKTSNSVVPNGYHRVIFKTDSHASFEDGSKEIVYDVIDGLKFGLLPIPDTSKLQINDLYAFANWQNENLLDKDAVVSADHTFVANTKFLNKKINVPIKVEWLGTDGTNSEISVQLKKASQLIKEVKVKKTSQWEDKFEVVKYDDQLKEIDYTQGYSLEASTPNGYTLVKSGYDKQANSYVLQYRNNKLDERVNVPIKVEWLGTDGTNSEISVQLKKASQLIKEVKVKKTSQWEDKFEVVKYDDQLKEIDYTQGYSLEASTPNGYTLVKSGYDKQANSYVLQYRNNKLDLVHHDHNHSMTNAIPNTADNNRSSFVFMFGLSFIAYLSLLLWRFYKRS